MTSYLALLRGINVGGKNRIRMPELTRLLESVGLCRIETYIQSGNVIFDSDEGEEALRAKIEQAILARWGYSVAAVIRTAAEFERLAAGLPFSSDEILAAESANQEGESLYVALLARIPDPEKIARLRQHETAADQLRTAGRDLYLLFHHSIRNSKLAAHLDMLGVPATLRNWRTVCQLYSLMKAR